MRGKISPIERLGLALFGWLIANTCLARDRVAVNVKNGAKGDQSEWRWSPNADLVSIDLSDLDLGFTANRRCTRRGVPEAALTNGTPAQADVQKPFCGVLAWLYSQARTPRLPNS